MLSHRCNARWSKLSGFKFKAKTNLKKGWDTSIRSFEGSSATRANINTWFPEHSSAMSSPATPLVEECARYCKVTRVYDMEINSLPKGHSK